MMISALINVILDPLLIFGVWIFPEMGIAGAAWASVFSRIIGTFLILRELYKRDLIKFFSDKFIHEMLKSWKEMIKISIILH
jgi:Na+-driven multidrug efflux pump